jgi:uncharacterized membrane protein
MIIWSGLGWLVFVLVFAMSLLAEFSVEAALQDDNYYQSHGWPLAVVLFGAAIVTWLLGSHLNRQPERAVEGPGGVNRHRFFFLPMQYWGPILAVLAVGVLALR